MNAPLKSRLFFWLEISNKILSITSDILKGRASVFFTEMMKNQAQHIDMLMDSPFTKEVWKEALSVIGGKGRWDGANLMEVLKNHMEYVVVTKHEVVPNVVT